MDNRYIPNTVISVSVRVQQDDIHLHPRIFDVAHL